MSQTLRPVIALAAAGLTAAIVTAGTTHAQPGPFPPTSLRNLQVLPKNAPVPAVIDLMKELTRALGVRCDHCHVGIDGQPLTTFDFVSDQKDAKNTARVMFRLVEQVNGALDKAVPGKDTDRVTCFTCHGGRRTPRK
jgi:hypothetical protein